MTNKTKTPTEMRDTFEIVEWPDVQFLMDKPGFRENSHLINGVEGINEYGSSAYLVNSAWLETVTRASPERERMIIVSITDISPQGDAYCSILTSGSPEDALNQLRGYIDTEISERGIEAEPDYDGLLTLLSSRHGNECSWPEEIEYEGAGTGEFIIAVKILDKTAWPRHGETGPSETIPLWLRLGGEILADVESMRRILSGDRDALVETIRRNGFMVNGQAYIPIEDISPELAGLMPEGICQGDDIDFDIGTDRITLRPDSP